MTYRYRCCFCGSFKGRAGEVWLHLLRTHRAALIDGLGFIEGITTRKEENPP